MRDGPNARSPQEDTKPKPFPEWEGGRFPGLRLREGAPLLLLEVEVPLTSQGTAVFFPVTGAEAYAQFGTHPIQMPNTDQGTEALLERGLHHVTWRLGSLATGHFEPLVYGFAQFGRMPMPAILQGDFSLHTHITQQLVGR